MSWARPSASGCWITGPAAAHFALFKLNLALGAIMIVMLAALNLHLGTLAADVRIKREMDKASALEAEFLRELALDPET